MILVLDNYDSFTWNLVHLIGTAETDIRVVRNDSLSVEEAMGLGPEAIVISPGPCSPSEAGISVDLVTAAHQTGVPLLGVCLGHQSIAQAFGGSVVRAKTLMHGRTSIVDRQGDDPLFDGMPKQFTATRYHSLVAAPTDFPSPLAILAKATDDGEIMALRVRDAPIWGVQFHPESIASEHGARLIANFLAARPAVTAAA
ncbi:anthranilate/para-aminobenzoate synthase component II [Parvularcula bermudensis HTCC2503]|uniref:Anthranilate/para-aminobenzoate synthase component II n=1 Tax=Parvularcula bermudensis (strain ATCC BAA-594 / HTCC2503 / KCTC 12087) TaxID=314260 RepID=E0TGT1_PARBH|nr:aminodeoxychorismate/anthranilate synthase component II [Parvularcula bermudensis]ADM10690.1 anthranilate/para-aminobenzoate synthase component II [Parvularcula bermudensis HTCC2503]